MGQPKSRLKIMGIKPEQQNHQMGIAFQFNQPVQLNPKKEANEEWFLPLEYFETLFKQVRFDKE